MPKKIQRWELNSGIPYRELSKEDRKKRNSCPHDPTYAWIPVGHPIGDKLREIHFHELKMKKLKKLKKMEDTK